MSTIEPEASASAPRQRRRQPEEARRLITGAAVTFLFERPFRELTVAELMRSTGLSRPAFYQYYRDLHELMESLLGGLVDSIGAVGNPWLSGEGEPLEALRESLRGVVNVLAENGPILRAVSEAAPHDERLERAWSAFMGHWDTEVSERIRIQQASGLVAPFDAWSMANALNALNATVFVEAFGRPPRRDPAAVLETLHRIWVGSIYGPRPSI